MSEPLPEYALPTKRDWQIACFVLLLVLEGAVGPVHARGKVDNAATERGMGDSVARAISYLDERVASLLANRKEQADADPRH